MFAVEIGNLLSFLNEFSANLQIFQPIGFGDLIGAGSSGGVGGA